MPGGDRRGPLGEGPMTGRRMGYCAGYDEPGYASPAFGRGRGGRGRGYRWFSRPARIPYWARPRYGGEYLGPDLDYRPDGETEKRLLQERAEYLESELRLLQKRLEELTEDKD